MPDLPGKVAIASDSERIAYYVHGKGSTALIFIHGWSCDARYWMQQTSAFSNKYQVITVDLVGHGHSSSNRPAYTIRLFAEDIRAVMEAERVHRAVLVGHSLGGGVIAECARLLPEIVVSIIGVDTLHDVGERITQQSLDDKIKSLEGDFIPAMQSSVSDMFIRGVDKGLITWVVEDMSSANKRVAINTYWHFKKRFIGSENGDVFKEISMPVVTINGPLLPTNIKGNRKLIKNYKNFYIEDVGHFPMLEKPKQFNSILAEVIDYI